MPGLSGAPVLLWLACLLKDPGLPWSDGLFLLMGAPTSSGGGILLLILFNLGLLVFWLGLFDSFLLSSELEMFWEDSLDLKLVFIFLGFAINWIGGFAGLLIGGVGLFKKVFLSWLSFCEGLIFVFWIVRLAWDCELLTIVGLLGFLGWFEIIFRLSGLLRGFVNNGFLFKLSLTGLPSTEETLGDLVL